MGMGGEGGEAWAAKAARAEPPWAEWPEALERTRAQAERTRAQVERTRAQAGAQVDEPRWSGRWWRAVLAAQVLAAQVPVAQVLAAQVLAAQVLVAQVLVARVLAAQELAAQGAWRNRWHAADGAEPLLQRIRRGHRDQHRRFRNLQRKRTPRQSRGLRDPRSLQLAVANAAATLSGTLAAGDVYVMCLAMISPACDRRQRGADRSHGRRRGRARVPRRRDEHDARHHRSLRHRPGIRSGR